MLRHIIQEITSAGKVSIYSGQMSFVFFSKVFSLQSLSPWTQWAQRADSTKWIHSKAMASYTHKIYPHEILQRN